MRRLIAGSLLGAGMTLAGLGFYAETQAMEQVVKQQAHAESVEDRVFRSTLPFGEYGIAYGYTVLGAAALLMSGSSVVLATQELLSDEEA